MTSSSLILKEFHVEGFRNLSMKKLVLGPGLNCFFGENGQGKTNFLEALYVLSHRKSFRKNAGFPQFVSMDCEYPEILWQSTWTQEQDEFTYAGRWCGTEQKWYENHTQVRPRCLVPMIFLGPFDTHRFHSSKSARREVVDRLLEKLSPTYGKSRRRYEKLLKQKNVLLSQRPPDFRGQLEALTEGFAQLNFELRELKQEFFHRLAVPLKQAFKTIFSLEHTLELEMQSSVSVSGEKELQNYFLSLLEQEIVARRSLKGAHLDDYLFKVDGLNSYDFCSLGQQKMSYLAFILSFTELFHSVQGTYPILLIDDVSGELDGRRWKNLIDYLRIKQFQVMITTANAEFRRELSRLEESRKFWVQAGSIGPLEMQRRLHAEYGRVHL